MLSIFVSLFSGSTALFISKLELADMVTNVLVFTISQLSVRYYIIWIWTSLLFTTRPALLFG